MRSLTLSGGALSLAAAAAAALQQRPSLYTCVTHSYALKPGARTSCKQVDDMPPQRTNLIRNT
eukprot:4508852-Alexandrium_andersonii.AAC.1